MQLPTFTQHAARAPVCPAQNWMLLQGAHPEYKNYKNLTINNEKFIISIGLFLWWSQTFWNKGKNILANIQWRSFGLRKNLKGVRKLFFSTDVCCNQEEHSHQKKKLYDVHVTYTWSLEKLIKNKTESFKYEALKLVPHTCHNRDSEFPGTIFPDCRCGEHPFWPQTKTAHCTSGLGLLAASTAEWTHWTASWWTGMETLRQRRIRRACNQAGGRREAQLTFRDIVTVQQAGVRVNVVLWAQRKESRRSRGETHC